MSDTLRFQVGISFAGKQRPYAERMAVSLARRLDIERILYDRFHTAEFALPRLAYSLPELYKKETELIVVLTSGEHADSEWCGLEWDAIMFFIKNRQQKKVMLFHADNTMPVGLHGLNGSIPMKDYSPEIAAEMVLERLAINQGLPRSYYINKPPTAVYETGLEPTPSRRRLLFILFAMLVTFALFVIIILMIKLF